MTVIESLTQTAYACDNPTCANFGIIQIVTLSEIAPGLLMRPPVICALCGYHALVVDLKAVAS